MGVCVYEEPQKDPGVEGLAFKHSSVVTSRINERFKFNLHDLKEKTSAQMNYFIM